MEAFEVIVNEDECKHLEWVCDMLEFKYKLINPCKYEITPATWHKPSSVFNLAYTIKQRAELDIITKAIKR